MRELARRGVEVSLFSLVTGGSTTGAAEQGELEQTCTEVQLVPFAPSSLSRRLHVLEDVALGRAFHRSFFVSPAHVERCRAWIRERQFDVVVAGQLYMTPYVPPASFGRTLLDTHNSESRRIDSIANAEPLSVRGLTARLQRGPVRRFEQQMASRVARVSAVSATEVAYFEPLAPGRVDLVPNGVDCIALDARSTAPAGRRLLFLGSLDYSANVDAVTYLARDVLPRLDRAGVAVDVVGSNPRRAVHAAAGRSAVPMHVAGYVPDTTPYWEDARVFVVPLRMGGGTRLKILEALARGVPVVSTAVGCEGLDLRDGEDLLVADDPGSFASSITRLLEDDALCRDIAAHGRATVEARYDWSSIGDAFERSVDAVARSA